MAIDLRASVPLVIAGLMAEGRTTINRVYHLDRGFERRGEAVWMWGRDRAAGEQLGVPQGQKTVAGELHVHPIPAEAQSLAQTLVVQTPSPHDATREITPMTISPGPSTREQTPLRRERAFAITVALGLAIAAKDTSMAELKLIAFDADDLAVLSAQVQDAVLRVGDIAYLPRERRFAAIANRFDWVDALAGSTSGKQAYTRRRAALRFERVLGAQIQGIDLARADKVISLLALSYEPGEAPEGRVTLHFADGAAIRLHVECIEAELKDLGPVWRAISMPKHPTDDPAPPRDT